jgi:hypothetical protein
MERYSAGHGSCALCINSAVWKVVKGTRRSICSWDLLVCMSIHYQGIAQCCSISIVFADLAQQIDIVFQCALESHLFAYQFTTIQNALGGCCDICGDGRGGINFLHRSSYIHLSSETEITFCLLKTYSETGRAEISFRCDSTFSAS